MAYRLGVDVGGTFTDLFLVSDADGGAQFRVKTPSTPADPVNVNDFGVRSIEAVEYYASAGQVPSMYSRINSTCGVFVIHTRRSP